MMIQTNSFLKLVEAYTALWIEIQPSDTSDREGYGRGLYSLVD